MIAFMSNPETEGQASTRVGISHAISESATIYGENVVFNASRGHGFAAEKVNHLHDVFTLQKASHDGIDLRKYGADRTVNGVQIQTKYCSEGAACISECFVDGQFVYWTDQGTPMQIEVPHNEWDDAVKAMRRRIEKGEVFLQRDGKVIAAITDPDQAPNLVRQGHYDYETVRAIAKSGTVESLTFDAVNGIRLAGTAAGVTAVLTYASAIWNGQEASVALEAACFAGLKVGGVAWVTSIVTAQLGRTGLEVALVPSAKAVVNLMGSDITSWLATGSGKQLVGASAKNFVAKQFRGSVTAAIASTIILSTADLFRMFDGKLSFGQLFKNVTSTGAGVAGGMGGFSAGAAQGAAWGSFIPGPGNLIGSVIGGFIGALAGSAAAQGVASFVLDGLIVDDAKQMLSVLQEMFTTRAKVYLLTKQEAEQLLSDLSKLEMPEKLRDMYASSDREAFAKKLLEPMIEAIVVRRQFIALPSDEEFLQGLEQIIQREETAKPVMRRVFDAERTISIDVPAEWELADEAKSSFSFPGYFNESARVKIWHEVQEIQSEYMTTRQYSEAFHANHQKVVKDIPVSELTEVTVGGRQAFQFHYNSLVKGGGTILITVTVVRIVKYWISFWTAGLKLSIANTEALDAWRNSVTVHSMNEEVEPGATATTSSDGNFMIILPKGWENNETPPPEHSPHRKFLLNLRKVASVEVCGFITPNNTSTLCVLAVEAWIKNERASLDEKSIAYTEHLINARTATTVRFTGVSDGNPFTSVFTAVNFDDCVVTFNAITTGTRMAERTEHCEALPWRLFRCYSENENE